jgi:hypothetical protein
MILRDLEKLGTDCAPEVKWGAFAALAHFLRCHLRI